jgi:hypothetical protein
MVQRQQVALVAPLDGNSAIKPLWTGSINVCEGHQQQLIRQKVFSAAISLWIK